MKKLFTLMLALVIGFGLKAQTNLTQAVDFTATDVHGEEVHLFEILDGGQYVLIDFFYTTCGYCIQSIPKMVEAYSLFGCNTHDVFFMEIDYGDNENACLNWVNTYGVEYPTIAGTSGGTSINNQYGITAFPTVILIAPDHQIVIQDLYPIPNTQAIVTALENQGIQQHDCNAIYNPMVTIAVDQVLETEVTATFTPNEDCVSYNYMLATEAEIQQWMTQTGLELPEYLHTYGFPAEETLSHTFTELEPETDYVIYAVGVDANGDLGEVVQEAVTTTPGGGTDIMPDFTATDIEGKEIHLYEILDAGQAVFINFFLYGDEFSENIMPDVIEAYRLYGCNEHDVFFMEICPSTGDANCQAWVDRYGVQYPTISRDGGGNDIAQAIPVGFYPTLMLIRPDHTIAMRDIYPPTLEYINYAMEGESYMQYPCYEETLTLSADTLYYPEGFQYWMGGLPLQISNFTAEPEVTIISFSLESVDGEHMNTFYISYEDQDVYHEYWQNDVCNIFIPQGETLDLTVWFNGIVATPCLTRIVFHNTLEDVSVIAAYGSTVAVEEHNQSFTLFPNPANDFVTISGENLGTVRVYNTLGQKVDEFEANGNELRINTMSYESGIYFVKTNEATLRFVVKH